MNATGLHPRSRVDVAAVPAVGQAGGVLLAEPVRATGLAAEPSRALAPWRKQFSRHDPGKTLTDLALMLAVGGDCLADVATVRAEADVYGPVTPDPTISRLLTTLAADVEAVDNAISAARRKARSRAWALAGRHAPKCERDGEESPGHRPGCITGDPSQRERAGTADVQEGLRVPSVARTR